MITKLINPIDFDFYLVLMATWIDQNKSQKSNLKGI